MVDHTRKVFPGFNPADGSVPFDNDILDWLMPLLSNAEFKVYAALCFEAHYNGDDILAISYARLTQITGLAKSTVLHTIWLLYAKRLIDKIPQARADGGDAANAYRLLPLPEGVRP